MKKSKNTSEKVKTIVMLVSLEAALIVFGADMYSRCVSALKELDKES